MTSLVKKAVLGTVLGAGVLTAVAPTADAQRYRHYRDRDNTGTAIVAGIAGLAIGAAIAGGDRRYDYDRRYYRQRGYYPTNGYYYRDNYRRFRGYERCSVRRVYDPYLDRRVRVRYCG
ncbi:hypothetical protein [Sphingomonas sp. M1-B02]|uniref:hypothetical protein n=1 Tax=Sphingomonas sp. M1-B02 TaxID=3114300 RepID=UPI00223EFCDA|nr:hypothetical protein [Sphingomonas sp. S6-11]UZK65801.1 hypothetical protein OKW87_15005 [Sphingomonas sp. S6-11]